MNRRRLAHVLALWFGCGLVPIAPGTAGSLGALPLYFLVRGHGPVALVALALGIAVVGVWSGGVVAEARQTVDPQIVVIDEVAGTLLALAFAPLTFAGIAVAFALFRVLDAVKIFPARAAERLHGGLGIVLDDVVAGTQAAVIVIVLRKLGVFG